MAGLCRALALLLALAWLAALALLGIGTWGLFGQEPDPLAGVFLAPLGLPWNLLLDPLPEGARFVAATLSPLLNVAILAWLCRRLRRG